MCSTKHGQAHLTGKTLYHGFPLLLRVIRPSASTEGGFEVPSIHIALVGLLERSVQSAGMRKRARRAVTTEPALWKELKLLMVGMACNRARRTDPARR